MMSAYRGSELEKIVDEMFTHMRFQIENPALLNNRFVFDEVLYLDVNFHQLNLTRGSSYLPLSKFIVNKKAVINPQNGDGECFKWAIITAENVGMKELEFPVSIKDIGKFEVKNGISVNVLGLEGKDIYIHRNSDYKSDRDQQGSRGRYTTHREINLLMISENGVHHYTAIKSLSRLLSSSNSKHKCKQYFCNNCLQGFSLEASRDQHRVYCEDNEALRVEMPRKGKTIEFFDGQNQFKVPFMMYYDLEALLPPMKE